MSQDGKQPRTGRLARWARGLRLDRNPLRRGTDRAVTGMLIVLIAAFVIGAPFVAVACRVRVHDIAQRNMLAERASHYQVAATLLVAAGYPGPGGVTPVRARWTAPDGRPVTGDVYVTTGQPAGATVSQWVLRDGQIDVAPLTPSQVTGQAELAMVCSVPCYALVLAAGGLLAWLSIERRRMTAWDSAWLAYGPRGTPRT